MKNHIEQTEKEKAVELAFIWFMSGLAAAAVVVLMVMLTIAM